MTNQKKQICNSFQAFFLFYTIHTIINLFFISVIVSILWYETNQHQTESAWAAEKVTAVLAFHLFHPGLEENAEQFLLMINYKEIALLHTTGNLT